MQNDLQHQRTIGISIALPAFLYSFKSYTLTIDHIFAGQPVE